MECSATGRVESEGSLANKTTLAYIHVALPALRSSAACVPLVRFNFDSQFLFATGNVRISTFPPSPRIRTYSSRPNRVGGVLVVVACAAIAQLSVAATLPTVVRTERPVVPAYLLRDSGINKPGTHALACTRARYRGSLALRVPVFL